MDVFSHHSTILCNSYSMGYFSITRNVLKRRETYGNIDIYLKERRGANASNGGSAHNRRSGTHSQSLGVYNQEQDQDETVRGNQTWWTMACYSRSVKTLCGEAAETRQQPAKLKAAFSRRQFKSLEVTHSLSVVFQAVDNELDQRYLFVYCTVYHAPKSIAQYTCNRQYGWQVR